MRNIAFCTENSPSTSKYLVLLNFEGFEPVVSQDYLRMRCHSDFGGVMENLTSFEEQRLAQFHVKFDVCLSHQYHGELIHKTP